MDGTSRPADQQTLTGRRALVTGATGGLGWAIGSALARSGCDIMLTDLDREGDVEPRLAPLREDARRQIMYRRTDLSQEAEITSLVATATERLGGVDILVNTPSFGILRRLINSTSLIGTFPSQSI